MGDVRGIRLDLGCGEKKHPLSWGVDRRGGEGVDCVHDLTVCPWPLETDCAHTVFAIHLWQEIPREAIFPFMSELWRVSKAGAEVFLAGYYGLGWRFQSDPRCVNPMTEITLGYWDPRSEWYGCVKPEARFEVKYFQRVPMGTDADYNAVLQVVK